MTNDNQFQGAKDRINIFAANQEGMRPGKKAPMYVEPKEIVLSRTPNHLTGKLGQGTEVIVFAQERDAGSEISFFTSEEEEPLHISFYIPEEYDDEVFEPKELISISKTLVSGDVANATERREAAMGDMSKLVDLLEELPVTLMNQRTLGALHTFTRLREFLSDKLPMDKAVTDLKISSKAKLYHNDKESDAEDGIGLTEGQTTPQAYKAFHEARQLYEDRGILYG